ncbi:single-stranded-DNA-specific exonuclease RecJ [Veillonella rodentium]|uniref:Single-stranded-DNA-specific exonuclease RecJ n=1 Tax=Veillonella rodentium TaxID=248315 RepID=A0A239ZFH9_9FIRM|nr:single-stranded-DNA-specific exonuclease RecJ [Veillonella rodentium]SNV69434.1 Single-stranded-DNA-specific exonuclease recJ [Veillonella rodentium]
MIRKKRWRLSSGDTEQENILIRELGVNPIVAKLMVNRHIDVNEGRRFLTGNLSDLLEPFTLKDMDIAVSLIQKTLESNKSIVIYGDYDVDGITATSLLYRFFQRLHANVSYYIPERQSEGYGLNLEALEHLVEQGTALVITVDCGISSYDIVEAVRDRLDIIITDHHTAPDRIPRAKAVINHKQKDCPYTDKNLSGVGVAFKLCQALWLTKYGEWYLDDLDIVALGTVADVVPLVGENRVIVKAGLEKMNEHPNLGIHKLIDVSGLHEKNITSGHIGFTLAPRLNAAGRVTHATRAVELLVTDDSDVAEAIAEELNETNRERQELERNIYEQARIDVLNQGHEADYVTVVAGKEWHPGVIGIVASRLVEEFYKPTLVISIHDGVGKGSCRSIDGFNIYDALKSCEDILIQFGGHAAAAGFSIDANRIDELRSRLTEYCKRTIDDEEYVPVVFIDAELPVDDIDVDIIDSISALEPYGMANSTPVFAVMEAVVQDIMLMGQLKTHCKVILETSRGTLDAIAWNRPELFKLIFVGTKVKVAFSLQKNEWQGTVSPQLMIQDIEPITEEPISLTAEGLRQIYVIVKHSMRGNSQSVYHVEQAILRRKPTEQNNRSALASLDVFKELGIVKEYTSDDGQLMLRWNTVEGKLDLVTSVTFLTYSR